MDIMSKSELKRLNDALMADNRALCDRINELVKALANQELPDTSYWDLVAENNRLLDKIAEMQDPPNYNINITYVEKEG